MGKPKRILEYNDKQSKYTVVCRINQHSLGGEVKVLNIDFVIQSMSSLDAKEMALLVDDQRPTLFVGSMAPSWSKDSKEFNEQSKKAPVGFFGCDDRGYLYINGHKIPEHFAGFGRGNVVGVELDYSIPSKPAVFISVDGMRTA